MLAKSTMEQTMTRKTPKVALAAQNFAASITKRPVTSVQPNSFTIMYRPVSAQTFDQLDKQRQKQKMLEISKKPIKRPQSALNSATTSLASVKVSDHGTFQTEINPWLEKTCPTEQQIQNYNIDNISVEDNRKNRDENVCKGVQQKLSTLFPGCYGVGGFSQFEIKNRFVKRQNDELFPKQVGTLPFKAYRQDITKVAQKIVKDKLNWYNKLIKQEGYTFFPLILDKIWPAPFESLLDLINELNGFKVSVLFGASADVPKLLRDHLNHLIEGLKQEIQSKYQAEIDALVVQIVEVHKFNDPNSIITAYYNKNKFARVPSSISVVEQFVSCHMERRRQRESERTDVQRYLEQLEKYIDIRMFQSAISNEEIQVIRSHIKGQLTLDLSCVLNQLLESSFLQPLLDSETAYQGQIVSEYTKPNQELKIFASTFEENRMLTSTVATSYLVKISELKNKITHTLNQSQFDSSERDGFLQFKQVTVNGVTKSKLESTLFKKQTDFYKNGSNTGQQHWSKLSGEDLYQNLIQEQFKKESEKKQTVFKYQTKTNDKDEFQPTTVSEGEAFHIKKVVPILLLCAKIAAVKAAEEIYCYLMNGETGKAIMQKYDEMIDGILDKEKVLLDGLRKIVDL
ncbi:Conserved_hypothetical protein [Hexamita inflata]|uniref:Uncharacterized protein n=1 Tax=Hexamita inflata TaxID=28002 RepID=A0AA86R7P5_9EUKA|nr:Conserved hypothetical protein [Hexamita inflata]